MSTVHDLIAELCPEGVEQKPLGEVGTFTRGNGLQKKDLTTQGIPAIHYGQVFTHYGTAATETKSFVSAEVADRLRNAAPGDLVIATTSENDEDVCKAVAWMGKTAAAVSGDAHIYSHTLDPEYASYLFQSSAFQLQKKRLISGTKVRRVSGSDLASISVPVPPVEVQREVAAILRAMERLGSELRAELEARRRQYEHYRKLLLEQVDGEQVTLADLGTWVGGMTPSKANPLFWSDGTIPWLASMDVSNESSDKIRGRVTEAALEKTSLKVLKAPVVAVVMRSNILRRALPVGLIEVDTTVNQDMRALVPREGVDAGYVFQVLRADRENIRRECVRTDGSMAAVDRTKLMAWELALPALGEQVKVASTLQKFHLLVNDLSAGLPAEIAARRRQYEYYRDLLLTFPEKTA